MAEREPRTTTIKVGALARVEGRGRATCDRPAATRSRTCAWRSTSRRGSSRRCCGERPFTDAPDITSRICGICPIAYQMSACAAIEDALGIDIPEPVWDLRRLIYGGEWLESHALHVFMLHAPDFLGYEGAIEMARDCHADLVERGLRIKRAGNELMRAVGGRPVHPINVRVGGFYRAPTPAELEPSPRRSSGRARTWSRRFAGPPRSSSPSASSTPSWPLFAPTAPTDRARAFVSTAGLELAPAQFPDHIVEEQVPHSTALHARIGQRATTFSDRSRATRSTTTGSRRSPATRPPRLGWGRSAVTRS